MLPAVMPSITRDTNIGKSEPEAARSRKPAALPAWLSTRTGFRPTRSLIVPRTGAAKSWQSEYVAKTAPIAIGGGPFRSAPDGRGGRGDPQHKGLPKTTAAVSERIPLTAHVTT